jgi:hypothetical protein
MSSYISTKLFLTASSSSLPKYDLDIEMKRYKNSKIKAAFALFLSGVSYEAEIELHRAYLVIART